MESKGVALSCSATELSIASIKGDFAAVVLMQQRGTRMPREKFMVCLSNNEIIKSLDKKFANREFKKNFSSGMK